MKQQTIETGLCTLLLVELPEGSINPVISMGYIIFKEPNYSNWLSQEDTMNPLKMIEWEDTHDPKDDYKDGIPVRVPDGNWKLIGILPELRHEDKLYLVDGSSPDSDYFKNYMDTCREYDSPTDSFDSLLKANEIYFENPFGKIHPHHPNYTGIAESVDGYLDRSEEWQEAQQKVWDRNNTYIFKQLKQ